MRCANPTVEDVDAFVDERPRRGSSSCACSAAAARGRRASPTLRAICERDGVALILLGGEAEPDAELAELSLAPAGAVAQAFEYLRHGGVENTRELLRFLADTFGLRGPRLRAAARAAELGVYVPASVTRRQLPEPDGRPRVGVVFYRSHCVTGNTAFVDALARRDRAAPAASPCACGRTRCAATRPRSSCSTARSTR